MSTAFAHARPEHPPLAGRRRWMAAQRLAAGERVVLVAARIGIPTALLREALADDEDFQELVEACREIHQMPADEWFRYIEAQVKEAVERALADGRVSLVNLLLRATGALEEVRRTQERPTRRASSLREVVLRMTPEERAKFDSLRMDCGTTTAKLLGEGEPTPSEAPSEQRAPSADRPWRDEAKPAAAETPRSSNADPAAAPNMAEPSPPEDVSDTQPDRPSAASPFPCHPFETIPGGRAGARPPTATDHARQSGEAFDRPAAPPPPRSRGSP